jgi:tetratricopeptide (TPR) repeat protein
MADVHAAKGEAQALRDTLNDAVTRYPQSPMVFMRRAQVLMQDKERLRDALADASKAVDLAPQSVQALRVRAGVHSLMGNAGNAVADIRAAIRIAPGDNDLIFSSVSELVRGDRDQDAQDLIAEALSKRPRDVGFLGNLSSLFASANRYDIARRYMRQAFDVDTANAGVAQAYLDVQLNNPAPEMSEAQRVLTAMGKQVDTNPGLLMASAKVRMQQNKAADAARVSQDALKLLDGKNATQMGAWYTDLSRIFPDKAQRRGVLEGAGRSNLNTDWMTFFRGVTLVESGGASRTEGVALLDQAARATAHNDLKALALRTKGVTLYQLEQHAQAVEAWQASMAIAGENADLLNNTAFVMAKHLGKAQEAVPLAERAAQLNASPEVLDTLGVVYLALERFADASRPLEQSMRTSTQAATAISAGLHLAEAQLGLKDVERTKEVLGIVQQLVDNAKEQVTLEQRTQLQELRTKAGMP